MTESQNKDNFLSKTKVSAIAVVGARTLVLGLAGKLLWRLPGDMKRFRAITIGHPVIMGRKTFESIGRALPGRLNIVVTRNKDYKPEGVILAGSLSDGLALAKETMNEEVFIIGGGDLYKEALPFLDRLYLTLVDSDEIGDTFFPDYSQFKKVIKEESREDNGLKYRFVILEH